MVAAAMSGMIDFRDADPLDRRWWLRLGLALDYIERTNIARQHRMYYDYSLAILSRENLREDSNRRFTRDAEDRLFRTIDIWRPWERRDPAADDTARVQSMREGWAREYGDPDDPETQQAIAETVRLLRKTDVSARKPWNAPAVPR